MKKLFSLDILKNSVMMLGFFLDPELVSYANRNGIGQIKNKDLSKRKAA